MMGLSGSFVSISISPGWSWSSLVAAAAVAAAAAVTASLTASLIRRFVTFFRGPTFTPFLAVGVLERFHVLWIFSIR